MCLLILLAVDEEQRPYGPAVLAYPECSMTSTAAERRVEVRPPGSERPALPAVVAELGGLAGLALINTSYVLAGAVAMLPVGPLGDRLGQPVDVAQGEIIVSTDADTRHPPVWLSRIDAAFAAGGPEVVAVAGPCRYADPPWWAALVPPLKFTGIAAAAERAGWVPYLTATNVAFRRSGFPGYDESLAFGGDEVDLLRRLRGRGRLVGARAGGQR